MKVIDAVHKSLLAYPSLYLRKTFEDSKFAILHHYFIVGGNGFEWAKTKDPRKGGYLIAPRYRKQHGDFVRIFDPPYGSKPVDLDPRFFKEDIYDVYKVDAEASALLGMAMPKLGEGRSRDHKHWRFASDLKKLKGRYAEAYTKPFNPEIEWCIDKLGSEVATSDVEPYPNFQRQFSCFWDIDPKLIQEDWRIAALEHLNHWLVYFQDPERVKKYHEYSNPVTLKEYILKCHAKTPKESLCQFASRINKDYGTICFTGKNWKEFSDERWQKKHRSILKYLNDAIKRLTR